MLVLLSRGIIAPPFMHEISVDILRQGMPRNKKEEGERGGRGQQQRREGRALTPLHHRASIRVVMLKKSRSSLSLCRCVPWKLALTTRGSDISSLGPQLWQFGIDKAASMIVVESQRVQPRHDHLRIPQLTRCRRPLLYRRRYQL